MEVRYISLHYLYIYWAHGGPGSSWAGGGSMAGPGVKNWCISWFPVFMDFWCLRACFWDKFLWYVNVFCATFPSMILASSFHRFRDGFVCHFWCVLVDFSGARTDRAKPGLFDITIDSRFFIYIRNNLILMCFVIFVAAILGIDCWCISASILAPFWHVFGIKCSCFGATDFRMLFWIVF